MVHRPTHDKNLKGQFEIKNFRISSFMYQLSFAFITNYLQISQHKKQLLIISQYE